jgi:hypothetical protein
MKEEDDTCRNIMPTALGPCDGIGIDPSPPSWRNNNNAASIVLFPEVEVPVPMLPGCFPCKTDFSGSKIAKMTEEMPVMMN